MRWYDNNSKLVIIGGDLSFEDLYKGGGRHLLKDIDWYIQRVSEDMKNLDISDTSPLDLLKVESYDDLGLDFDIYDRETMCMISHGIKEAVSDQQEVGYYSWHPQGECIKFSQEFSGNLAQAIQYIYRSGCPGATKFQDTREDLQKAIDFLQYEIGRIGEMNE